MEYQYKVKTKEGLIETGIVEAGTQDQAVNILHDRDLIVLSLESVKKNIFKQDISAFFARPNKKDIVFFTRQLSTLIDANVPLVEGLRTISRQTSKLAFSKVVSEIAEAIEGGSSLSKAFAIYPSLFSPFFISLVRAGEVSGRLETTLLYLADYLERSQSLNSKIRGALAYPIFVIFALIVVTIIMVTTVLPNLLSILKEAGAQELPLATKLLIFGTDFINKYLYLILIVIFALILLFFRYTKTKEGRDKLDNLKLKLPIIGGTVKNLYIARISETLSTLFKSGVPVLEALIIASDVVGNKVYRDIILEAEKSVRAGGTISAAFSQYKEIPPIVSSMLAIGEKTGKTDFMLEHIFKFYKSEADTTIQNLSQLIEPILVLILGLAVGILVAAVLLPIYNLVGVS